MLTKIVYSGRPLQRKKQVHNASELSIWGRQKDGFMSVVCQMVLQFVMSVNTHASFFICKLLPHFSA